MDNEEIKNQAKEPEMVFFKSFEEAEDYDNKWLAAQRPEQHLQNTVQLIKRLYSKELALNPEIGRNFKID